MAEPLRSELSVHRKRGVLVSVLLPDDPAAAEPDPLAELRGLVETAGVEVVGTLIQKRQEPAPATCLGSGKVEELKALIGETKAEVVIFDNSLSPAQGRNLEKETESVIVDRSEIILDIFATRARTYEARLQVELAQLLYTRPRLKKMWGHLSREAGGGSGGGSGGQNKGTGEQQLEIDRRLIDVRINDLRHKLVAVENQRARMVAQRKRHSTASLVGYTNAGKSTLMSALTGADVYIADKLFATLDTKTRAWKIPHWGEILLSDTVGFIRNLPHHLVASFRSTLEEARHADVLLHVVDSSHPQAEHHIDTVHQVLGELGIPEDETILVLNKIDANSDRSLIDVLRLQYPDAVPVSAVSGKGLDRLSEKVAARLSNGYLQAEIETSVGNGRLFNFLAEHAEVTNTEYQESRVTIHCRIPRRFIGGLRSPDTNVTLTEEGGGGVVNGVNGFDVNGHAH